MTTDTTLAREKNAHLWARHPDDWYVEPAWCNDALFAKINFIGTVVDPCCGSGTTLLAAKQVDRKWLGYEINPEHVETARSKLGESA